MLRTYLNSIEARFTLIVVLACCCFFGGIGYFNYQYNKAEKLASVQSRIAAAQSRMSAGLEYPLWEYNEQNISQIVNGEMQAAEIVGISVSNLSMQVYGTQKGPAGLEPLQANKPADLIHAFDVHHNTGAGMSTVGRVTLLVDLQEMHRSLQHDLWIMLMQLAGVAISILIAMSATLRGVVLRPLGKFDRALADIASGDADLSLRLPPNPTAEFSRVTDSFNTFVEKLHSLMGGSIREVQLAISRVELGDHPDHASSSPPEALSVLSRLSEMHRHLTQYQDAVRKTTEDLRFAMQAAESATRIKSEFLANMSHEIRTPMNAIVGFTSLALSHDAPPRTLEYLRNIHLSADHLMSIISDILDVSKIESGMMKIEAITFDLHDVIARAVNLLDEKLHAKGLTLTTDMGVQLPRKLVGDPLRIGQILINFLGNAIKFTSRGNIHIRCEVTRESGSQCLLKISVTDTGIGIRGEQSAKLFQSFEQADSSTTRQYGGTGLGLSISKQLAQAMGGEVGHHSVFGEGSTFWFSCKVVGADVALINAAPHSLEGAPYPAKSHAPQPPVGTRVLLVEDNALNQMVAREILELAGCTVEVAGDGARALELLLRSGSASPPYDIVLMDIQMPVMDGLTATIKLREHFDAHTLPVLAMTANAMTADRERSLAAGMAAVVVKPFKSNTLLAEIARWVVKPSRPQ